MKKPVIPPTTIPACVYCNRYMSFFIKGVQYTLCPHFCQLIDAAPSTSGNFTYSTRSFRGSTKITLVAESGGWKVQQIPVDPYCHVTSNIVYLLQLPPAYKAIGATFNIYVRYEKLV